MIDLTIRVSMDVTEFFVILGACVFVGAIVGHFIEEMGRWRR